MHGDSKDDATTQIVRIAAWMWIIYLAALILIDRFIIAARHFVLIYYLDHLLIALVFLGLAYWSWVQRVLKKAFIPLMITWLSAFPIILNHFLVPRLRTGPLSSIESLTLRLLPVLFIALILTAWSYRWKQVLLFSLATAVFDLLVLQLLGRDRLMPVQPSYVVVMVRTVSFLVVGYFITRLITRMRTQQQSLQQANLQLAHYASTLEQLTISRERNRMARELHDTLAHTLSSLSVNLEAVKAYWRVEPDTAYHVLEKSLLTTHAGIEETRRALKSLRASPLEDLGLLLALRRLVETASERGRLQIDLEIPDHLPPLSPAVEQCIYRIAQEAVENVLHHANAKKLTLHFSYQDERITLLVQDDGSGYDPKEIEKTGHYGLVGMHERAQLVGAQLEVRSSPGAGTRVELML